jgi:capsular polysaccharide transport system permease protein
MFAKVHEDSPQFILACRRLLGNRLFIVICGIPTILAIVYFGFMASDVYVCQSSFVIRSPENQVNSPLGVFLNYAGLSKAQDDSYAVQDFIVSRDALKSLDEEFHLSKVFGDPRVDLISRFAGLSWNHSFESLYHYYEDMVDVELDSSSSIVTLTTRAFTAPDAYVINDKLVKLSDQLVNTLNVRARQDMVGFAVAEVSAAKEKAQSAAVALAHYRNKSGVIDPEKQSIIPLQQIAKLQDELVAIRVQLAQLEQVANQNPQLSVLRQRARLLEGEIKAETNTVAGGGDQSLAGKAAEYQRLALEKEFSDKMLASAMSTLEQARVDAQRKQLYLELIVQPSKPDYPVEPRRIKNIVVAFFLSATVWGIISLLLAGIKEHHE